MVEYKLSVWKEKPEDLSQLPFEYWRVHVTDAYKIPEIGESIESSCGLDDYERFRVFDVRHNIGGVLSYLVTDGRSQLKEARVPEGEKGLVHVLAYAET